MNRRKLITRVGVAAVRPLAGRTQQTARGASKRQWAASAVAITFGVLILLHGARAAAQEISIREHQAEAMPRDALPLDAFGFLGDLFEARFYEPHATTGHPHDEIRQAASLYGLDLTLMMSIAKVESNFKPSARTGSYKGLFQLSDREFEKYGGGSIWDARDNARAAGRMFLVQAEKFKWALGHYPDYAERYMVHQQGIQGAIEHYTHPARVAWQSMCATDEGFLKGEQWCRKAICGILCRNGSGPSKAWRKYQAATSSNCGPDESMSWPRDSA